MATFYCFKRSFVPVLCRTISSRPYQAPTAVMALIKYSALVSDMRNKLNGSVLSQNRAGSYMRNKITPVNPQTVFQQAARGALTQVSQSWRGLTEAQRAAWNSGSVNFPYTNIFGDKKTLSGQGLYVKLNLNILKVGGTPITLPPTAAETSIISGLVVSIDSATNTVNVTYDVTGEPTVDDRVYVEATPLVPAGISFVKNMFRYLATGQLDASSFQFGPEYVERFGPITSGGKYFVRVSTVNRVTGQSGVGVVALTIAE